MAKTIYIKNVHEITLFCKLHSLTKKTVRYNQGTKCVYYTYQIPSKCIICAKIEPLKFCTYLLNLSFSRPFQFMKINSTESYVFFLARTYRARINWVLLIRVTLSHICKMTNTLLKPFNCFDIKRLIFLQCRACFCQNKKMLQRDTNGIHV